jgi:hypothetical protein
VFSLLAIISTGTRFALLEPARTPFLALEVARLAFLAFIVIVAARGPVLILVITPGAFVALETARRPIITALIVTARGLPVVAITGIPTLAEIAAFLAWLVIPVLVILSLVKSAHTRLKGTRVRSVSAVRSMSTPAEIR